MKLPYANDYFDKSLAQLVLWSVPDAKRAVVEMFRVTRARGILAACVWGSGEHNERSHLFWEAAIAVDAAAKAQRETPGGYDREGGLYALWADCSLKEVKEVSLPVSVDFASFDEFWLPHLEGQGRVGSYVESLPRDHQEALRKRLRDDLLALKGDGPFSLRAEAVAVRGIR